MSDWVISVRSPQDEEDGLRRRVGDWLEWIAENKLRRCSPDSMIGAMVERGIDPRDARAAVELVERDPCYRAALKMRQLRDKLASVTANLQKVWEGDPTYAAVEKRAQVPADEFAARYL